LRVDARGQPPRHRHRPGRRDAPGRRRPLPRGLAAPGNRPSLKRRPPEVRHASAAGGHGPGNRRCRRERPTGRDMRTELTRRQVLRAAAIAGGSVLVPGPSGASGEAPAQKAGLPQVRPQDVGIDPRRLQVAYDLMEQWTAGPKAPVPGGAVLVGRFGKALAPRFFGRQGPEADAGPIRRDALFYMASVTKPVVYLGAMLLVERGRLNLSDPVKRYL